MSLETKEVEFANTSENDNNPQNSNKEKLEKKVLKQQFKYWKKRNKLLSMEIKEKKTGVKKSEKNSDKSLKSFFERVGAKIIESIPKIIPSVVKAIIGALTSGLSSKKTALRAGAN